MPLADAIGRFIGRAELVLAGADDDFRAGQDTLAHDDPMGARSAAKRVLARVPSSPLGLALLADACEAANLEAELVMTLEELAASVPSRPEVWARLGRALAQTQAPQEQTLHAFARALEVAEPGSDARRDALFGLADLDLAQGNSARADLWLDREPGDRSTAMLVRRAEARLLRHDARGALEVTSGISPATIDARLALVRGRAWTAIGDPAAFSPLMRAWVLDEPGAGEALSSALARVPSDTLTQGHVRALVTAKGEHDLARWQSAFTQAREPGEGAVAAPAANAPGDAATALDVARRWIPTDGSASAWPELVLRLSVLASEVGGSHLAAPMVDLIAERASPLRLVVVGEFNAGKSTFINALVGANVAATGILPTTALLHHLRWAPHPVARIIWTDPKAPDRVVASTDWRAGLSSVDAAEIRRVEIGLPAPALARMDVVDTPGFNAHDPAHAELAWCGLRDADLAVWILDATLAFKHTERRILEDAAKAGVPVQIVIHKADRLAPAEIDRVAGAVSEALRDAAFSSFSRPFSVSSKKAIAGKAGDGDALRESGWHHVETFFDAEVATRRDELKERAARRRASCVVGALIEAWTARQAADLAEHARQASVAEAAASAASRIETDGERTRTELKQAIAPAVEAWASEMSLVFAGRDPEEALSDPRVERYAVDRAIAGIVPALARSLTGISPGVDVDPRALEPVLRAVVRTAALRPSRGDADAIASLLARAGAATLLEHLTASSSKGIPSSRAVAILHELRAMAACLAG